LELTGEQFMTNRNVRGRGLGLALGLLVLWGMAPAAAAAQGVTGTVSGVVKDAQGGVVPGATVTLISEARGTVSAPAISSEKGDFVFPNLTPDTYTIQVEMPSFKTLRRSGLIVSPGSTVAIGALVIVHAIHDALGLSGVVFLGR